MARAKNVHLVILIHGLWGSPAHLFAAKEELENAWKAKTGGNELETEVVGDEEDPTITTSLGSGPRGRGGRGGSQGQAEGEGSGQEELVVVIAGGMTSQLTYDGVDVCASRVAWEVDQEIEKIETRGQNVTRFSVTGYSLGGLVARYLVGLLHSRTPSFFEKHKPVSFSTIATPHLGVPRYNTFLSTILIWLGSRLLSRSGEQLYVTDQYSEQDPRPLLEIMADPTLIFSKALGQFERIQIFANGVNDHTVPYPSAAIETVDHFAEWENQGLEVEADEADIITSWSAPPPDTLEVKKKRGWGVSIGTLPPVLRYRFPFNYMIMLLFPVMLPLVITLIVSRLALDTRRSRRRLQQLSQAPPTSTPRRGDQSPSIPSAAGLSIQSLRDAIRRVERELESDLIESMDSPTDEVHHGHVHHKGHSRPHAAVYTKVDLKDSQLRMALWLNKLPIKKYITWYPDVANAHSVSIVRDPTGFPAHNQGRGLLRRWAQGVLS
ncbi:putative serine esterase-domain-containing protein [Papiliotrema laurentii]|uniref:Serine esterase-domain-containing protein n=1 Tax=Papiliotrema laurentii TaxID=5418 RepID=A0AAD9L8F3_PAPLA|nr:putative serine esterase-domain-containing protein [Papiliotrema laurentii]